MYFYVVFQHLYITLHLHPVLLLKTRFRSLCTYVLDVWVALAGPDLISRVTSQFVFYEK